jgi:hypothetical protein
MKNLPDGVPRPLTVLRVFPGGNALSQGRIPDLEIKKKRKIRFESDIP